MTLGSVTHWSSRVSRGEVDSVDLLSRFRGPGFAGAKWQAERAAVWIDKFKEPDPIRSLPIAFWSRARSRAGEILFWKSFVQGRARGRARRPRLVRTKARRGRQAKVGLFARRRGGAERACYLRASATVHELLCPRNWCPRNWFPRNWVFAELARKCLELRRCETMPPMS